MYRSRVCIAPLPKASTLLLFPPLHITSPREPTLLLPFRLSLTLFPCLSLAPFQSTVDSANHEQYYPTRATGRRATSRSLRMEPFGCSLRWVCGVFVPIPPVVHSLRGRCLFGILLLASPASTCMNDIPAICVACGAEFDNSISDPTSYCDECDPDDS